MKLLLQEAGAKRILDSLAQNAGFTGCSISDGVYYDANHTPCYVWHLMLDTIYCKSIYPISSTHRYITISSSNEHEFDRCMYVHFLKKCVEEVKAGYDLLCGVPDQSSHSIGYTGKRFCTYEQLMIVIDLYGSTI